MSGWQFQQNVGRSGSGKSNAMGAGCLILFAVPFAGFGVFALVLGVRELSRGKVKDGLFLGMFGLVFSGVGFGLMAAAVYGARNSKKQQALQQSHPDEPWRWRTDWAEGRIEAGTRAAVLFPWIFALFWNGVSSGVWFVLPRELARGNRLVLIALLFPLIGVGLLIWAVRATIRFRRFGKSFFELASTPVPIGGQIAGLISTQHPLEDAESVKLRLACVRREQSGDSTTEHLLWEDEKTLEADAIRTTGGIPVFFNIPADAQPASPTLSLPRVIWRLQASAKVPGVDYAAQFELPVFQVAGTGGSSAPVEDPTERWQKDAGQFRLDPKSRIRVQAAIRGENEFIFPAARFPGVGIGLTVFFFLWSGFLWILIAMKAPLIFRIVWSLFDVLLFAWLVGIWFGSSRVVAGSSELVVHRHWLFIRRKKSLPASEIKEVTTAIGMTAGSKAYYDLKAITLDGKKIKLASMIESKREAEWLAGQISAALNLMNRVPQVH